VKTSILVEFHRQKKRLLALCSRSIKSRVSAVNSLFIVSMRFLVNGAGIFYLLRTIWLCPEEAIQSL
jgi:hypothetical protein